MALAMGQRRGRSLALKGSSRHFRRVLPIAVLACDRHGEAVLARRASSEGPSNLIRTLAGVWDDATIYAAR